MSRLRNFLNNLQNPADRQRVAANLGIDLKAVMSEQPHNSTAHTLVLSGNQNYKSEVKMKNVVTLGHRADGVAVTSSDMEKDVFGWYKNIVTFTDEGTQVYQLQQSMTMKNAPEDFRITSESDFQEEVRRGKELLGLN